MFITYKIIFKYTFINNIITYNNVINNIKSSQINSQVGKNIYMFRMISSYFTYILNTLLYFYYLLIYFLF